jgi:predicted benzoate:H+ symporter BenE
MIIYQNPAGIGWLDGSDCDQPISALKSLSGVFALSFALTASC